MSPFSFRIRELREKRGWSQSRLAAEAGVRQATISGLETGRLRRVELPIIERIGKALGVNPASLFEWSPQAPKERTGR